MAKSTNSSKSATSAVNGEQLVDQAYKLFDEVKTAYEQEWTRQDECEQLYRADHWDSMTKDEDDPTPTTPVLHSTVESIAADLMDRMPEAIIRAESVDDETISQVVCALIKQNHDAASYRKEYRSLVHDLLVDGYGVQEIGYDVSANRGLGAAFIRWVDCHNIMFDPQVDNLQDGRAVFKIRARTIEWLEKRYPQFKDQFQKDTFEFTKDSVLKFDQDKNILLIEYWWREFIADGADGKTGKWQVHMAKLAGRKLLEDSREAKPDGYFATGEYPFVITPLFARKGSCLGWGLCDIYGEQQKYSDKLDQITLKNAAMASHNKILVTEASGFDSDDLADWSKEVHKGENLNGVTWFQTPPLPQYQIAFAGQIREGVREESGANDVSRGNIGSGVTSAAAITALQDMSSKRSRMISDILHESFKEAVRYEIEVEREYNVLPREVTFTDQQGQSRTETFESAIMSRKTQLGNEVPIEFFISIKVQQENRWTIQAHNDLIIQMVELGMIAPDKGVELMEFEGKESLIAKNNQQVLQPTEDDIAMEQQAAEQQALEQQMASMPAPEQAIA